MDMREIVCSKYDSLSDRICKDSFLERIGEDSFVGFEFIQRYAR